MCKFDSITQIFVIIVGLAIGTSAASGQSIHPDKQAKLRFPPELSASLSLKSGQARKASAQLRVCGRPTLSCLRVQGILVDEPFNSDVVALDIQIDRPAELKVTWTRQMTCQGRSSHNVGQEIYFYVELGLNMGQSSGFTFERDFGVQTIGHNLTLVGPMANRHYDTMMQPVTLTRIFPIPSTGSYRIQALGRVNGEIMCDVWADDAIFELQR